MFGGKVAKRGSKKGSKKSSRKGSRKGSLKRDNKPGEKKTSSIEYLHNIVNKSIKGGKINVMEEKIITGSKGITVVFYSRSDDKSEKVIITGQGDKFTMKVFKDGKPGETTELNYTGFKKALKDNKNLGFASKYFDSVKGGAVLADIMSQKSDDDKGLEELIIGGAKRRSSKKGSRKGSRKGSKKGSRKH
jgi:hypothetical protein